MDANERGPPGPSICALDAADTLRRGLRYLDATEDSAFNPKRPWERPAKLTVYQLVERIGEGTPSACVAALWELAQRGTAAAEGMDAVRGCLSHRQAGIRAEAARTLAALGPLSQPALPRLLEALQDIDADVRAAAAYALGKLVMQPEETLDALVERLDDGDSAAACAAAWAIAQFGRAAEAVLPAVLAALKRAITVSGYEEMDHCCYAVRSIATEPTGALGEMVESCDPEIRPQAVALLGAQRAVGGAAGIPGSWFGR